MMACRANLWILCLSVCLAGCNEQPLTPTANIPPTSELHAGVLEVAHNSFIGGWAWQNDRPDEPVEVELFDGETPITTIKADRFRQDLLSAKVGNGKHAFEIPMPKALKDGRSHEIHARIVGTSFELKDSPRQYQFKDAATSAAR